MITDNQEWNNSPFHSKNELFQGPNFAFNKNIMSQSATFAEKTEIRLSLH